MHNEVNARMALARKIELETEKKQKKLQQRSQRERRLKAKQESCAEAESFIQKLEYEEEWLLKSLRETQDKVHEGYFDLSKTHLSIPVSIDIHSNKHICRSTVAI